MSNVYLVDDHALLRDGLRAVLAKGGHRVVGESGDITQALADIRRLEPDVLVLDLHLGTRSGFELLEELQRRKAGARTVVLTMSAQPRNVAEALRLGVRAYLLKGGPPNELLVAIERSALGPPFLGEGVADLVAAIAPNGDSLDQLSARERQIAVLVAQGFSSTEIGKSLHLSPKTVDTYRSRLMAKLGTPDLPALVRFAVRKGLIEPDAL